MTASKIKTTLAPGLLVSMPHLKDDPFARAVVLMIEHNENGSFGFILNQPNEVTVSTMLELLDLTWYGNPKDSTWNGGPVMPESGWVLHEKTSVIVPKTMGLQDSLLLGESMDLGHDLHITVSPEKLALLAQKPTERIRFLLGYSGWGKGQLEHEISKGSWIHADINADMIFDVPAEKLWEETLLSMGIQPQSLVSSTGVH